MNETGKIRFKCPHCLKPLIRVATDAGTRIRCPGCGLIVDIPMASQDWPKQFEARPLWRWYVGIAAALAILALVNVYLAFFRGRTRTLTESPATKVGLAMKGGIDDKAKELANASKKAATEDAKAFVAAQQNK